MAEFGFSNLADAFKQITKLETARDRRVRTIVRKAARAATPVVRQNIPRAFGELADSLHVVDVAVGSSQIVVDAPHSAAVENGSRPHRPPLAPLILWVTLRGMQGLTSHGNVKSNRARSGSQFVQRDEPKDWRREASRHIATALRARMGKQGAAAWTSTPGPATMANPAVVAVARAIQAAIAKRGTKPFKFMQKSVGEVRGVLGLYVEGAIKDR